MSLKSTVLAALSAGLIMTSCSKQVETTDSAANFIRVDGPDLVLPDGSKFFIQGTNLGNWMNPEGYMFGFGRASSPRLINEVFSEIAGPEAAAEFWKQFKDNYITKADIDFIASTGANTIRLPFHYKLFTDEDYMGLTGAQDGFERVDTLVEWCRDNGLYLILDMHDAPGGQTGDNIDDSYGYPWLFESPASQEKYCNVWRKIADHYKNEPVILGYELFNEPIAPYFENMDSLNNQLVPVYKKGFDAIREVDKNHIVLIGGAQWNGNFNPIHDANFDEQVMYTCHRYGGQPTPEAISNFIEFRDRVNRPMYMGEIGHNSDKWQAEFVRTMKDNNIGYTFWPYKKIHNSCMVGYNPPEGWDEVRRFADAPRGSFAEIRDAKLDRQLAIDAMNQLLENVKFENCVPQESYIASLQMK